MDTNGVSEPTEFYGSEVDHEPLVKQIGRASAGLVYISETDAAVVPFEGGFAASVSKEEILRLTGKHPDSPVEERDFCEFFDRLTQLKDWFNDERIAAAKKFLVLRELMERNLRELKVFRIGNIRIEIYAVGIDSENKLTGITTHAVET